LSKNIQKNKIAMAASYVAIFMLLIAAVAVAGTYIYMTQYAKPANPYPSPQVTLPPGQVSNTFSGQLYMSVIDSVLKTAFTTSAVTVDQVAANSNGVFDFINGQIQAKTAQAANPQAEGQIFAEGDKVVVMLDCTGNPSNGLDYYPTMYYMQLGDGQPIYEITSLAAFQQVTANPYTYTISTAGCTPTGLTVHEFSSAFVNYWNLGSLALKPRQAATDVDIALSHGVTALASVTDGSSWVDTVGEITANCTLTSASSDSLTFTMTGGNKNLGWGAPFFVFDSAGKVHPYGGVLVISTGILSLQQPVGWDALNLRTLTNEVAYYKVLNEPFPQSGMTNSFTVSIPMSVTADSTKYKFSAWLLDCQNLDTLASQGSTTTAMPTAYGFVTSYGVGAVVQAVALTISNGASATPQLEAYITTPS
jgi:hypothetical protein